MTAWVQLPDNLFFGTSIATCIMVLKIEVDNATLFIDASKECVKVTNSNKLTQENIENIVAAFAERGEQTVCFPACTQQRNRGSGLQSFRINLCGTGGYAGEN